MKLHTLLIAIFTLLVFTLLTTDIKAYETYGFSISLDNQWVIEYPDPQEYNWSKEYENGLGLLTVSKIETPESGIDKTAQLFFSLVTPIEFWGESMQDLSLSEDVVLTVSEEIEIDGYKAYRYVFNYRSSYSRNESIIIPFDDGVTYYINVLILGDELIVQENSTEVVETEAIIDSISFDKTLFSQDLEESKPSYDRVPYLYDDYNSSSGNDRFLETVMTYTILGICISLVVGAAKLFSYLKNKVFGRKSGSED